ncbi:MAG: hypothetical protein Q8T09_21735 [Candidatus Melainabacteria bacterium]|nr:hypothetical protein [Candidatus Melainabacteria bacterium]
MAQKGDDTFNKDVEKAVKAGSDFSQGGEHAYKALMTELAQDQKKYANDPAKFDELGRKVAAGLEKTGKIDDHMLRWSRDNMGRFDTSGDGKVDQQEMNPRNPTAVSGFEKAMMHRLQNQYEALNKSDSIQPLIGSRDADDAFSQKNFKKLVEAREKPITESHEAAQRQELAQRQLDQKNNVVNALMKNDGDPRTSLAAVLDVQRGVNPDGEISRRDIRKFVDNFEVGKARGDLGYTQANLDAAKLLDSQWNDSLGVSLRGQFERHNGGGHGGQPDMVTHDRINLKRMAELQGTTVDQLYAANVNPDMNTGRRVASGQSSRDGNAVRAVSAEEQLQDAAPQDRQPGRRDVQLTEAQELAQRQSDQKGFVIDALMSNNGDPRTSLGAVLDIQRGVNPDGDISRRDVRKFIENFDQGQARGDLGYTQRNLDAAKLLDTQWDKPLGVSLRGEFESNRGHGDTDKQTHQYLNLKRMAELQGTNLDQMYAAHARGDSGRQVASAQPRDRNGVRAVAADDQGVDYPADERPVTRPVARPADRSVAAESTDGAVAITDPSVLTDRNDPAGPAVKDDGRPTTRTLRESARVDAAAAPAERQERPASRDVAPAAKPFEAPKPIPELVIPEIKLDGDLVKAREELAKSASEHFQARAIYTVRPGQGWDRIARDVLRQEKDGSHANESLVVALSDHVAKGNGWEGRLDPTKMLHPGDQVRVMTDEAVKARTEDILKQFDAKVEEMKKAAAAKPADNGDPALFDDKRSGGGDIAPPAAAETDQGAKTDVAPGPAATPELFDGKRSGEGDVKPAPAADTLKDSSGAPVLDGGGNPVKTGTPADSTVVPNAKALEEPATAPLQEPLKEPAAGTKPQLKASNDTVAPPVVAGSDVAAPGEDFAVTAVSADAKADAEYQAKQKAARDKRLLEGNPLESFEAPSIT